MLGGHLPELLILLVVALVIFGPKRLPEIGGAMGRGIKEFKRGTAADPDEKIADRDIRVPDVPVQIAPVAEVKDATQAPPVAKPQAASPLPSGTQDRDAS